MAKQNPSKFVLADTRVAWLRMVLYSILVIFLGFAFAELIAGIAENRRIKPKGPM
jgi:hypothetical protein